MLQSTSHAASDMVNLSSHRTSEMQHSALTAQKGEENTHQKKRISRKSIGKARAHHCARTD